jgi:hypothetical protein
MSHGSLRLRPLLVAVLLASLGAAFARTCAADQMTPQQVTELLAGGGDLKRADLSGIALPGASFTNLQAAGSNWDGADLRGAIFHGADLSGASLVGAKLSGAFLERVNLSGAKLTKADLAGARISDASLVGADLSDVDLRGAALSGLRFSPAGDRFLPALAIALDRLLPPVPGHDRGGLDWAAGLSTTAFAFSLDSANFTSWPGTPVTFAPLATAIETTGAQTTLRYDQERGQAFYNLNEALKAGSLCLLPLDMSQPGQTGDGLAQPIWAVAEKIEGKGSNAVCVLQAPPFGELRLLADDLNARWGKSAPTMLTLDQKPQSGRYLMLIIKPATKYTRSQMGIMALRNGVATLSEVKARGTRWPGLAGLQQLASLVKVAVGAGDAVRLADFAAWGAGPRRDLAGARRLAADFLNILAAVTPAEQATLLQQAATLYRTEADALDTGWADLSQVDMKKAEQATPAVDKDLDLLNEAIAAEQQALGMLQRVAGETH